MAPIETCQRRWFSIAKRLPEGNHGQRGSVRPARPPTHAAAEEETTNLAQLPDGRMGQRTKLLQHLFFQRPLGQTKNGLGMWHRENIHDIDVMISLDFELMSSLSDHSMIPHSKDFRNTETLSAKIWQWANILLLSHSLGSHFPDFRSPQFNYAGQITTQGITSIMWRDWHNLGVVATKKSNRLGN